MNIALGQKKKTVKEDHYRLDMDCLKMHPYLRESYSFVGQHIMLLQSIESDCNDMSLYCVFFYVCVCVCILYVCVLYFISVRYSLRNFLFFDCEIIFWKDLWAKKAQKKESILFTMCEVSTIANRISVRSKLHSLNVS